MRQRLQGKEFQKVKNEYKLKTFVITDDGNVKAYLKHKITGWEIIHYLNDEEKIKFKNSEYIKNCYRKKKSFRRKIVYGNLHGRIPEVA